MPHSKEPLIPCPACQKGVGRAVSVTMAAGHKTVAYVCTECEYRWSVTTRDPDELLQRGA